MNFKQLVMAIGVLIIILIGLLFWIDHDATKEIEKMTVLEIDMSKVQDGTYQGEVATDLVSAVVEVVVKDHTIESIELIEHHHGMGYGASEIVNDIVETNSLDVDFISGVTLSSEAIKRAVSLALFEGY